MAKSSIDKLNLLLKENKRYYVIFNFVQSQSNKKEIYTCIINKLQSRFKEKTSISIINNIIKLVYKICTEEGFDYHILTKGELYYLSKLSKIYNDYVEKEEYDLDEDVKNKAMDISSKVNEMFDIDNNPSYRLYFQAEQLDANIDDLNERLDDLIKKYRKKNKVKKINNYDENTLLNEILLIIESLNKELINIEHEALKNSIDNEFIKYDRSVMSR